MIQAEYQAKPQINDTCTGCAFKWIRESQCVGPCPDWARPKCTEDKIRWVNAAGRSRETGVRGQNLA